MTPTPYALYQYIEKKGYIPPMAGQITLDSMTKSTAPEGKVQTQYTGTGDHLKMVMEYDRVNVFKTFYEGGPDTESTWIAGADAGKGMMLPLWAERLIHADVLVMQEKVDTTMDYLIHALGTIQAKS